MSEGFDFYKQQAFESSSDIAWLLKIQKEALTEFNKIGFPLRGNEDWKYTKVDSFLKQKFIQKKINNGLDAHAIEMITTNRHIDSPVGIKIPIVNGEVMGLDGIRSKLPPGVIITSLMDAIINHKEKIKPYLNQILQPKHGFQFLNTAMLRDGLFIYIPENVCVVEPLLLAHLHTESQQSIFLRHLIIAKNGSETSIIEDYQGDANTCYFTNVITELFIDEGAAVKHHKIQRESKSAFHFGHVVTNQLANSSFVTHLLNIGAQWSRSDTTIDLNGELARCSLSGIYMSNTTQHMDQQTSVNHLVANCYSEQDYRGIVNDKSKAIFNGKVFVAQAAKLTEARQQNKNLLLSNEAEVYTKPQLDIYSDDVICTHGATVGQLDMDALFYFLTRGIDEMDARSYLLQAFAADNLQAIENRALSSWMGSLLIQQMG